VGKLRAKTTANLIETLCDSLASTVRFLGMATIPQSFKRAGAGLIAGAGSVFCVMPTTRLATFSAVRVNASPKAGTLSGSFADAAAHIHSAYESKVAACEAKK
jgi:hypothetical protein